MTTLKEWPPYAEVNKLIQRAHLTSAEITLKLDEQGLSLVRDGIRANAVERAELIAERSRLRCELLVLGTKSSELKAQFNAMVHENFLDEIKKVMNAAGIGHQYAEAFNKTIKAAQS